MPGSDANNSALESLGSVQGVSFWSHGSFPRSCQIRAEVFAQEQVIQEDCLQSTRQISHGTKV